MFFGAGGRWKGMSKRRMPQGKARIVSELLNADTPVAELCRKHDASPATFQDWKDKFMEDWKQAWGGDHTQVRLEARAGTERTHRVFSRNAQAGAWMASWVCPVKTQRWCWPGRLQTATTAGHARLRSMSPQTSLPARWRMGID